MAMAHLRREASELVEIFQWITPREATAFMDSDQAQDVRDEVVDILTYLLRFADITGIDLDAAKESKAADNARRYSVEASRGASAKARH